jgi:hypothetical protein
MVIQVLTCSGPVAVVLEAALRCSLRSLVIQVTYLSERKAAVGVKRYWEFSLGASL